MTIKKDLKIYGVNLLYLTFNKVNGYFKEINGSQYLPLVPIEKGKEKMKNMNNFGVKSEIYLDQ